MILVAIHVVVVFLLSKLPGPKIPVDIGNVAGIACLILALIFIVPAVVKFVLVKTTMNPFELNKPHKLVVSGLYRVSRNPMYFGMLLILIATLFFFYTISAVIVVPSFIVLLNKLQIEPEEKALTELFGAEYKEYCDRVRRWI